MLFGAPRTQGKTTRARTNRLAVRPFPKTQIGLMLVTMARPTKPQSKLNTQETSRAQGLIFPPMDKHEGLRGCSAESGKRYNNWLGLSPHPRTVFQHCEQQGNEDTNTQSTKSEKGKEKGRRDFSWGFSVPKGPKVRPR